MAIYASYHAVLNNHKEIVDQRIKGKADLNAKDRDGLTPLDHAINQNNDELIILLRKHGAITK
jgi:ankyrin repeat protein